MRDIFFRREDVLEQRQKFDPLDTPRMSNLLPVRARLCVRHPLIHDALCPMRGVL